MAKNDGKSDKPQWGKAEAGGVVKKVDSLEKMFLRTFPDPRGGATKSSVMVGKAKYKYSKTAMTDWKACVSAMQKLRKRAIELSGRVKVQLQP